MPKPKRREAPKTKPQKEVVSKSPVKVLKTSEKWLSKKLNKFKENWATPTPKIEPVKRSDLKALGKSLLRFTKAIPNPNVGLVVHGKKFALRINKNPDGNVQVAVIDLKTNASFNYIFDGETGRYIKRAAINAVTSKPGIEGFELSNGPNPNLLLTLVAKYRPLLIRELAKQRVKARRRKR